MDKVVDIEIEYIDRLKNYRQHPAAIEEGTHGKVEGGGCCRDCRLILPCVIFRRICGLCYLSHIVLKVMLLTDSEVKDKVDWSLIGNVDLGGTWG